jgi:hypothetical protein
MQRDTGSAVEVTERRYRQAAGCDCWEFDFRENAEVPGIVEMCCRAG